MFVIAQIWDNRISVHEQGVLKYSQGWIQEFDIGGGGGGGGGGGAKSYTPSQRGVQGCVYIEFRWKGGGGAHPLHLPPGSSPVGRSHAR